MKCNTLALVAITPPLSIAPCARAQMGMDLFEKPTIAKAFHPAIGKGAAYENTSKESSGPKTRVMEISIVGKENVDGKEAFWMESATTDEGQQFLGKTLMSLDDRQFHRMIIQMPGGPALEMPFNPPLLIERRFGTTRPNPMPGPPTKSRLSAWSNKSARITPWC